MKLSKLQLITVASVLVFGVTSCENQDITFDDYEGGSSVYFAYQYPVRTIVLGESEDFDTTIDNEHRCQIYATMGGVYKNEKRISVDIDVDNTLCDNLYFEDGSPVVAMPSDYYSLGGDQIVLDNDKWGYVDVQFTDAFFADPNSLKNTYVIPLVMSNVVNADRILTGTPLIEGDTPVRTNSAYWNVQPKDFVLYCLKFINPWHASYLRRGIDRVTRDGETETIDRGVVYVEDSEVCKVTTAGLKQCIFPVTLDLGEGEELTCDLLLTFDDNNHCTITSNTEGYTAQGEGDFVKDADSWANKKRDALHLSYSIDFGNINMQTNDTLVVQTRGVGGEQFTPTYNAN